jgi:hypothetical protein
VPRPSRSRIHRSFPDIRPENCWVRSLSPSHTVGSPAPVPYPSCPLPAFQRLSDRSTRNLIKASTAPTASKRPRGSAPHVPHAPPFQNLIWSPIHLIRHTWPVYTKISASTQRLVIADYVFVHPLRDTERPRDLLDVARNVYLAKWDP